jgi:hypothetical protein
MTPPIPKENPLVLTNGRRENSTWWEKLHRDPLAPRDITGVQGDNSILPSAGILLILGLHSTGGFTTLELMTHNL